MKRFLEAFLTVLIFVFTLTGCGENDTTPVSVSATISDIEENATDKLSDDMPGVDITRLQAPNMDEIGEVDEAVVEELSANKGENDDENESDLTEDQSEDADGEEVIDEEVVSTASYNVSNSSDDMRGIWIATVKNIDYPKPATTSSAILMAQADAIISNCKAMGINTVFLQVRPASDAFYKSSIFPWSMYLTGMQGVAPDGDFDPLLYWINQCHANGMELHAWINPYRITKDNGAYDVMWNALAASNPAKQHPEWVVRHKNEYYFDPAIPEVRQLVIDGVLEIVRNYDVDGIHFDDYFYPNSGQDFNDAASYALYGGGMNKADWRRENVNTLVRQLKPAIQAVKPGCEFGISPSGVWDNAKNNSLGSNTSAFSSYSQIYADTRKWALEGWVDYIAPQVYWNIGHSKADYATVTKWWADTLAGCNTKLYIGMADYKCLASKASDPFYGANGVTQMQTQLAFNDALPKVSGEIHYNYTNLFSNPALVEMYRAYYH